MRTTPVCFGPDPRFDYFWSQFVWAMPAVLVALGFLSSSCGCHGAKSEIHGKTRAGGSVLISKEQANDIARNEAQRTRGGEFELGPSRMVDGGFWRVVMVMRLADDSLVSSTNLIPSTTSKQTAEFFGLECAKIEVGSREPVLWHTDFLRCPYWRVAVWP